jgi:small-conductance mechanosensitive channel
MMIAIQAPVTDVLRSQWFNNSLQAWLTAAITAAALFVVLMLLRRVAALRLSVIAERTTNRVDDMIVSMLAETRLLVLFAISLYFGMGTLNLGAINRYLTTGAKLLFLWQVALWGGAAVAFWVKHYMTNRTSLHDRASIAMVSALGVGAKLVLWVLVGMTALKSAFDIEITALITGLGVGGIAIALAVQNILGDLLAALAIVFDKPFDVGDSIAVDKLNGTVEHIGLKTTRIRSVDGEQVVVGNGDLLKSRLRNFKRMRERRMLFHLDVTFDTPVDVLARLPKIVEEIITAQSPVRFDRSHVASFGESAIRIETVYFVLDPDYTLFMNIQQAINLEILRRFAAENVRFAFPSRTVYHEGGPVAGVSG